MATSKLRAPVRDRQVNTTRFLRLLEPLRRFVIFATPISSGTPRYESDVEYIQYDN